jgi:hypothetical protein
MSYKNGVTQRGSALDPQFNQSIAEMEDMTGYFDPALCGMTEPWRKGQCDCTREDEFGSYDYMYGPCEGCVESNLVVGRRVLVRVSRASDGAPPSFACQMDSLWVGAGRTNEYDDFVDVSTPLIPLNFAHDGETVEWSNWYGYGSGVASITNFEFCETMDDAETVEAFEPHAAILAQIFGIDTISKDVRVAIERAAIYPKKKRNNNRVGKYAKPSGYDIGEFEKCLKKLKSAYAKIIRANFVATYEKYNHIKHADYVESVYKSGLAYADTLAGLIAHALVECEARKENCPIAPYRAVQMQKPCPHVAPKAKNCAGAKAKTTESEGASASASAS